MTRGNEDDDAVVRRYVAELGEVPRLSARDETLLAQAIEAGAEARRELTDSALVLPAERRRELRALDRKGAEAAAALIETHMLLVVGIVRRYEGSGVPFLDLVAEGNLGLMRAVERFDWRKGFAFSTYATWWIRQAVTRGIGRERPSA